MNVPFARQLSVVCVALHIVWIFAMTGTTQSNCSCSERYDLVLLDLNLPGADGMTVLRTLRQTDRDTKVLILSARSEVADKVEGLDAGANDYLSKPFHLDELEARIRSPDLSTIYAK